MEKVKCNCPCHTHKGIKHIVACCDNGYKIISGSSDIFDDDDFYDDEPLLDDSCPNCRHSYDEIDYEYQICHHCGFNNQKPK